MVKFVFYLGRLKEVVEILSESAKCNLPAKLPQIFQLQIGIANQKISKQIYEFL